MEEVETQVLSPHRCHLGEAPSFEAATGRAWWFDILERKLFEAWLETGEVSVHALPEMASAIAAVDAERQLVFGSSGLHIRDRASGRLALIQPIEADNPATRSNDGYVHPSGAFWAGTMGIEHEERAGAIYWFFRGELRLLYDRVSIPNAFAFTPDGRAGYFIDTPTGLLKRVALDPANGYPVGEPQVFVDQSEAGDIDGAVLDEAGTLWCARFGAGCIEAYSPEGRLTRRIRIPASQPTRPCFAGEAFDRLIVTSALEGMDEAARAADPHGGKTFLLDVGARGRPETPARPFA